MDLLFGVGDWIREHLIDAAIVFCVIVIFVGFIAVACETVEPTPAVATREPPPDVHENLEGTGIVCVTWREVMVCNFEEYR